MQASEALWKSNAFTPSSARAVRPSAASARSRRVKRSVRAAEASAIAQEPRAKSRCASPSIVLRARANASRPASGSVSRTGSFGAAFLLSSARPAPLAALHVPAAASQQFGTLAGNSTAEKHMPFRELASSHRSAVAHRANHSVKRDGLTAAPYLKR